MYCRKCGKWIPDDSNYCNYCGNKITLDKKEKRADQISPFVLFLNSLFFGKSFSSKVASSSLKSSLCFLVRALGGSLLIVTSMSP